MAEATYFVGVTSSTIGANKHHLTLMNSGGSGRLMRIYKITACGAPTAAVTGWKVPLHAFRMSTQPTGGTSLTLYNAATGQGVVAATTAIGMTVPSNALTIENSPFGVGSVSGEETGASESVNIYEFAITGMRPIEVASGSGVTIRQGVGTGSGALSISLYFTLV
mgnify:CR=1 FL=1